MWVPSLANEGVDIGQMAEELHIQKGPLGTQHLPLTLLLPSPLQLGQCPHLTEESSWEEDLGDGLGNKRQCRVLASGPYSPEHPHQEPVSESTRCRKSGLGRQEDERTMWEGR